MQLGLRRTKFLSLEGVFLACFALVAFVLFYFFLSSNGLILGNDPAVHLQHTQMFLEMKYIPLGDIAWFPPLYHVVLATFMAFTGATEVGQILVLMKCLTALFDVLLVLTVYIMGAKFFDKRIGVFASVIVLLCFPLYELNAWGGYTSILGMTFMLLLFLYLALSRNDFGTSIVVFVLAFSTVLSHQLVTFLTVVIAVPFIVVLLAKSRGTRSKAAIIALLGGGVAFFLYYFQAIIPHMDILIQHVFFDIKTNLYQLPSVSLKAFLVNFGFLLVFTVSGVALAFVRLRKEKKLLFFLLLCLGLFVPLFFAESYLFGLYLPYQTFVYYMVPFIAIFSAVTLAFVVDTVFAAYSNNKNAWKRGFLKVVAVAIVVALVAVMAIRFDTVSEKVQESSTFYSLSDVQALDAGKWLGSTYLDTASVVVKQKPGSWFSAFSNKYTIAQTDPTVDRIVVAECVLDCAYEIETPATLVRAYESKDNLSTQSYVSVNGVWQSVSFLSESSSMVSFHDQNDMPQTYSLAELQKQISLVNLTDAENLIITYSSPQFTLTQTLAAQNDSYPLTVTWAFSPTSSNLTSIQLELSNMLVAGFSSAYVNGALNWQNPWDNPSKTEDGQWANTQFTSQNLTSDPYIGVEDPTDQMGFFTKFSDIPANGNIGVLSSKSIDAVRFTYTFPNLGINQSATSSYQLLTVSQNSFPTFQNAADFRSFFDTKGSFTVIYRSYVDYLREQDIHFMVSDSKSFDSSLLKSGKLELIYANDGYVILKFNDALFS
jgi:hypothetical protein